MLQLQRGKRERERGQIVILFALVLVIIMAFTALVVDVGLLRNNRQTLVNAMDAGALAGGTLMPVDGSKPGAAAAVTALVKQTVEATYRGIDFDALGNGSGDYTIEYRCMIGYEDGKLRLSDIPIVCDPTHALGHKPGTVSTDFIGAGKTRSSICKPELGDKCNTVVVRGDINTRFSFGSAVGVDSGNTGTVNSAACNGPCGERPAVPVDVVVVIDRSDSMSGDEGNLRTAAKAVLQAYDPAFQHVALGMLGPSTLTDDCNGSPGNVHAIPLDRETTEAPDYRTDTSNATVTAGATSLSITKPSGATVGDVLVAGITVDGGTGTTITPPTGAGGWTQIRRTNNGTDIGLASYYHIVTAADNATTAYAFGISPSRRAAGGIIRYSGVDLDHVIDVSSGRTGTDNDIRADSINTNVDDTALVGFFAIDIGTTINEADSMDEQFEARSGNSGGTGPTISGNTDTQNNDDDTGNREARAGTSNRYAAQLIALRPTPVVQSYGTNPATDMEKWIPVGLTGTGVSVPPVAEPVPYIVGTTLQTSTKLVRAIDCFQLSGTGTNLATPMAMAREYLKKYGRTDPKVKKGIIFETDGTPNYNGWTGDSQNYTCAQAKTEAGLAKAAGIEIFTIGFGVNGQNCPDGGASAVSVLASMATDSIGTPTCNASENTDNDHFFCQPAGSSLTAVFQAAAAELADLRSHLVQVYPQPWVAAVGPSGGNHNGGTIVTITGENFTGATSVKFGSKPASFSVQSDTTIRATAPPGDAGKTVDIRVSSPGGTSPIVGSDKFTYN